MSLGALFLQEYPSVVYQLGTTSTDPNIKRIKPYLDIKYFIFFSSELLNL